MKRLPSALLALVAMLIPSVATGQDSTGIDDDGPEWLYADSLFVQEPSWIHATVAKDIVVLSFRDSTTAAHRAAIIQRVHGSIVYHARTHVGDGLYYVRVASHPDACGVQQALDILDHVPAVETAGPHMLLTWVTDTARAKKGHIADGGMANAPATRKGSKHPCPPGTGLLR